MFMTELEAAIEAILFACGESVEIKNLAKAIDQDTDTTKSLVKNLNSKYVNEKKGIIIIEVEDSFQMCTNPEYFSYIKKIYESPKKKNLSPAILETLAIIAYKQPVTKAQIEEIRGVNSDHAVNILVKYNLVEEKGKLDAPGRPFLFGTTEDFLRHFGFKSLSALPEVEDGDLDISEDLQ